MSQTDPERDRVVVPLPPHAGEVPVLQKLSSPPFPRSGFPLLGILASVYEHVISVASRGRSEGAALGVGTGPTGGPVGTPEPQSPQKPSGRA